MLSCFTTKKVPGTVVIRAISQAQLSSFIENCDDFTRNWIKTNNFTAKPASVCVVPGQDGAIQSVLLGVEAEGIDRWSFGALPQKLPTGVYELEADFESEQQIAAFMAWGLGAYHFDRYRQDKEKDIKLLLPENYDSRILENNIDAIYTLRNLMNTPTEDMGPEQLASAVIRVGDLFNAKTSLIVGDELLEKNYPTIHAVGRGSCHAPRLIDLQWGDPNAPKLTLVGKGVCFDSGGLDIKSAIHMRNMKKDMGGAAHALALAQMIMGADLPLRLRLLIPAVENAVGSRSYRPGDVIKTRAGHTVEVGNTDAEGRLILCDALAEAASEKPAFIIDFATLTGAASVALGMDIPAFFCNQDEVASALLETSKTEQDPFWRLPLYEPYFELMKSDIADFNNISSTPYGGSITAALFLQKFVDETTWAHFDLYGWNGKTKPGKPVGADANAVRAVFTYICQRWGKAYN